LPFGGKVRPVDDGPGDRVDFRNNGQRDSDRILYSSAFRRLSGVTQVVSPQDEYIYHDRSMHSLKVAQVAQRTAQLLIRDHFSEEERPPIDPDIVYAAALAHDLGHPPFGHAAEHELQQVLSGKVNRDGSPSTGMPILRDTFEGNAQSLRIVARLAARKNEERLEFGGDKLIKVGLNLTWRTYAAIIKYPWAYGNQPPHLNHLAHKWAVYDSESIFLERAREEVKKDPGVWPDQADRSLEAQVMDWADDVAYAVHDTEDFFRAGLIPMDRLYKDEDPEGKWIRLIVDIEPAVRSAIEKMGIAWESQLYDEACQILSNLFPGSEYLGDSSSREAIHYFASRNI
jgi:dGTPase